jgi:hypothetical protein
MYGERVLYALIVITVGLTIAGVIMRVRANNIALGTSLEREKSAQLSFDLETKQATIIAEKAHTRRHDYNSRKLGLLNMCNCDALNLKYVTIGFFATLVIGAMGGCESTTTNARPLLVTHSRQYQGEAASELRDMGTKYPRVRGTRMHASELVH